MSDQRPVEQPSEWQPRRVAERSWRRPALGITGFGLAIVILAVASRSAVPTPRASSDAARGRPPEATASRVPLPRAMPAILDCHDLPPADCAAVTRAAITGIPDDLPAATSAAVWASLICGSTFDCPPSEMRGAIPRGSVALFFGDHDPVAWLNVVDRASVGRIDPATVAWVVRWERADARAIRPHVAPPPSGRLLPS